MKYQSPCLSSAPFTFSIVSIPYSLHNKVSRKYWKSLWPSYQQLRVKNAEYLTLQKWTQRANSMFRHCFMFQVLSSLLFHRHCHRPQPPSKRRLRTKRRTKRPSRPEILKADPEMLDVESTTSCSNASRTTMWLGNRTCRTYMLSRSPWCPFIWSGIHWRRRRFISN